MLTQEEFRKMPIFITTMSRWDGEISSASLALAKVFSASNHVYYIDFPYTLKSLWQERRLASVRKRLPALLFGKNYLTPIPNQSEKLVAATPGVMLPAGSLPEGMLNTVFTKINNFILARLVKRILKEKKIKHYLMLNSFNPFYLSDLTNYLNPTYSVYQSRDNIEAIKATGTTKENECTRNYNLVLATSNWLSKHIARRSGKNVAFFPNGADVSLFKSAMKNEYPKPIELQNITTPIIGYTGAVCQRIDYPLLEKLAKANPDKTLVLVGPRKNDLYSSVDLNAIPNIVFTGPKTIDELPAYLQYFDCTIIPFVYNNFTAGIYPLKINEYLAAGKPVVTTNFSEDIASFGESVYLSATHEDFIGNVSRAIEKNNEAIANERTKVASENDWTRRVEYFWDMAWTSYVAANQPAYVQERRLLEVHDLY
ncbi:glycosyltransferase [Emticicia agri]|uniref:Glycosyltransferase n=1 Tax=Emticicia agri TaxID=2492393 RepID=A0A4Q5LVQ1_9BACT|nr:glycosyltransferase [Emticicia agri]RYU93645.1 glycosyltransferase [Emticicia agri]